MKRETKPLAHNEGSSLVTIALFAYNQEQFIREAVEGVLNQTYSPLEIIISDDCSQDETFDIIKEIAADYEGPHKIILNRNEKNLGIGSHVNRLFEMATGEFVVMAAGDDISLSHRTEALVKEWERNNAPTMLLSNWRVIDSSGKCVNKKQEARKFSCNQSSNDCLDNLKYYLISGEQLPLHGATAAYRKDLLCEFRPLNDDVIAEDYALFLRSLLIGSISYVDSELIKYRVHGTNVSALDEIGSERYRTILRRNIPSYENLKEDIEVAQRKKLIDENCAKTLKSAQRRFSKSAGVIAEWNKKHLFHRYLSALLYIVIRGPRRHKRWFRNRILMMLK